MGMARGRRSYDATSLYERPPRRAAALRLSAASAAPAERNLHERRASRRGSVYVRPFAAEDELPRHAHYSAYYAVKTIADRVDCRETTLCVLPLFLTLRNAGSSCNILGQTQ